MLYEVITLETALQAHLVGGAELRSFSDGQIIQHRGDTATGFWLIEHGTRITSYNVCYTKLLRSVNLVRL